MRRIIVGAIMLLAIPVLANSGAIANFAVERYADYTHPPSSPLREWTHSVPRIIVASGEGAGDIVKYERIYSADTGVIVRDSALALLGVGGVALIVSAILRGKK